MMSQISYATDVWSPPIIKIKSTVERVQRRATSWILQAKRGEITYKQRLITLGLLPLCYEREIKDLRLYSQNSLTVEVQSELPLSVNAVLESLED
jgi:hypothetical protein